MGIRRPNRQIEVFDISLMAVVTKAMGAFLVIMLLLMPYYTGAPVFSEPMRKLNEQIEDMKKKLEEIERNVRTFTDDPEELKRRVATLLQQLDEAKARMTELQRQLDQAWAQTERLKEENAQLEALRTRLESQRDALIAQKALLEKDNAALKAENAALREVDQYMIARPLLIYAMDLQVEPTCREKLGIPAAIRAFEPKAEGYQSVTPDPGSSPETSQKIAERQLKTSPVFSIGDLQLGNMMLASDSLLKSKTQREQSLRLGVVTGQRAKVYIVVSGLEAPLTRAPCQILDSLMVFFDPLSQWVQLPPLYTRPSDFGPPPTPVPQLVAIIEALHPDLVKEKDVKPPVRLPTADDLKALKEEHKIEAVLRIVPPGQP